MAYELFPEASGAILRGILETTYNSGPTVADANVYRCPLDATFDSFKRASLPRTTQAAFISGVKASPGQAAGEYSIQAILDHHALTGSTNLATYADLPQADIWLRAGGWQGAYATGAYSGIIPDSITNDGGSDERILTYTYKPRSTSVSNTSARWQYTEIDESNEGLLHDIKGARHGWTLDMPGGDHWTLSCDGKGLPSVPTRVASPTLNSTFDDNDAIVGVGGNYALTKFESPGVATYGKASETAAASTMSAFVYNMSLASNLEISEIVAPNGTYGVAAVRYASGIPQLKCTIDQVIWSEDWDLYSFLNSANGIRVSTTCALPGSTTSFVVFTFTGQIVDIVRGSDNGYRNVELTLDYIYPENSDDGGLTPAAGITLEYVTIV